MIDRISQEKNSKKIRHPKWVVVSPWKSTKMDLQACGRNSTVADVDLSLELEQLAVSGQRGVHLWQILSQAPVEKTSVEGNREMIKKLQSV